MIEVSGIAHIQLSVTDMTRSVPFYRRLLTEMGLQVLIDAPQVFYCIGAKTGVAISPVDDEWRDEPFVQRRTGLHHVCFRAKDRASVDAIHELAKELQANIVHPPQEDNFAPGYYSVLFEDPDGVRIEANFVPGKGWFAKT